jgi:hypothetical protein
MNIIGATTTTNGFKRLAGKFDRNYLMKFEQDINDTNFRFTKVDTQESVDVFYNPNEIKAHEDMNFLMQKCIQENTTSEEKKEFLNFGKKELKIFQIVLIV